MLTRRAAGVSDPSRLEAVRRTGLLETGPEESFERLGALARRLVTAPVALVSLVDADRQHFKCCLGLAEPWASDGGTPLSHSICQYALASAEPLVITDVGDDPRLVDNGAVTELGAKAYLGIPLVDRHGHVLGSFCVLDTEPRPWTDDDVMVMSDLAASVMAEIELRELAHEREQAAAITARDEARLRAIMDGLFILVWLLDADGNVVESNAAAADIAAVSPDEVVGHPLWTTAWWGPEPVVRDLLHQAVERARRGAASRFDTELRCAGDAHITIDLQVVPLTDDDGQVVGIVASGLDISERKHFERDLARLAGVEAERRRQAEELLTLARVLSRAVDVDEILEHLGTVGADAVGADFATVAIASSGGSELELRHGRQLEELVAQSWQRIDASSPTPLSTCVRTGRPVYLSDSEEMRALFPGGADDADRSGLQALAALPMAFGSRSGIGFGWREPTEFTPDLQNTLAIVAQLAGQALERAASYEREHQIADQLQRSLLPQSILEVPDAEIAARYEAGAASLDVGGDWYDVVALPDGRYLLAVGDVVGRGLGAAAAMGQLRNAFDALAIAADDVVALVERLDLFAFEVHDARLSTLIVADYAPATGDLRLVSAGHLPALVRRADGTVVRIDGGGPPLGFAPDVARSRLSARLDEGDCLFLYTDGLAERRGESLDRGIDRVAGALEQADSRSAQTLVDQVIAGAQIVADGGGDDDVAVLAMIRTHAQRLPR